MQYGCGVPSCVPCWQWLITQYLIKPDPITYYAECNKQTEIDCQPLWLMMPPIQLLFSLMSWCLLQPAKLYWTQHSVSHHMIVRCKRNKFLVNENYYLGQKRFCLGWALQSEQRPGVHYSRGCRYDNAHLMMWQIWQ